MKKIRTDTVWMGILLGTLLPAISFGIFYAVGMLLDSTSGKEHVLKINTILLISIFTNLFSLRYYLIKLKYDRTGRGILLITFVLTLIYFGFYI